MRLDEYRGLYIIKKRRIYEKKGEGYYDEGKNIFVMVKR